MCLLAHQSVYPANSYSVSHSVCPSVSQSVSQSVCLSVHQSVSRLAHQLVSWSVRHSVSPSVRQSIHQSSVCQCLSPSVHQSISLLVSPSGAKLQKSACLHDCQWEGSARQILSATSTSFLSFIPILQLRSSHQLFQYQVRNVHS